MTQLGAAERIFHGGESNAFIFYESYLLWGLAPIPPGLTMFEGVRLDYVTMLSLIQCYNRNNGRLLASWQAVDIVAGCRHRGRLSSS